MKMRPTEFIREYRELCIKHGAHVTVVDHGGMLGVVAMNEEGIREHVKELEEQS